MREPAEQVAAGVGGADLLGDDAVDRAGVQALLDQEGGRAGDLVAGHHRVLDGRGAAPGGEQREVQVDPAVLRDLQGAGAQQGAVGDDRAAVGRELGEPGDEVGVARLRRLEDLDPGLLGALGDGAGDELATAAGGGVGAGDHRDDLVPVGGEQGVQGGNGDLGGAGEHEAHQVPFCSAELT